MKNPIHISNIRRPLKGILLFIILLIASNLFISSISQFFIINREIDNISKYYRSVGTIVPTSGDYDVKDAREIIMDDPMISLEDIRRETIGIIDGLYSFKRYGPSVVGTLGADTLDLIFIGEVKEAYKSRSANTIYEGSLLAVKVTDILAGIPDLIESESLYKNHQEQHHVGFISHSLITGEKYEYINDDVIDELFQIQPGKKYLFRSFVEREFREGSFAKPLYEGGPLYIELDDTEDINWSAPKFRDIKEEIDFINENITSYSLTGTKDMTAMPEVQNDSKDFYLIEGRWIDNEDDINQNHVLVINKNLAEIHEINIGDKFEIKMRDSEYGMLLYSEKDHKEWKTYYKSEPISFEVVGIYESNVYPKAYSNFMYIPESTIPVEFGRYTEELGESIPICSRLYSFVLKDPADESAFIEKYREPLKELGYEINFVVNNIENFLETSAPIKRSTSISLILFSILLILIQGFVIYVYVDGHKLNYAIERALGIPAKISGRHLIEPLIIYGSIASIIGGYIGYKNAMEKSAKLLEDLVGTSQRTINSGLEIRYFILFLILSIIPFAIMLLIRTKQLKNASVIDLINDNKRKRKFEKEVSNISI